MSKQDSPYNAFSHALLLMFVIFSSKRYVDGLRLHSGHLKGKEV